MNTNLLDIDHKKNIYLKYKRLYVVSLLGSLVLQFGTEQQNNFEANIDSWKNDYAQTDDILLLGIKIG